MRCILRLALMLATISALMAPAALAGERMWVGFHDDPSYRWVPERMPRIERSAADGATIVRLLVQWNLVAPQRPSSPADPFDPVYKFDDVDEAVQAAQEQGQEAMLTISGTPRWASGGEPNRMPRNVRDLRLFAQAIAARYSGRFEGFPFVRFWSVWNEPNLNLFLTPQFDSRGRSVAPRNYAKLYAAAYAGIKAGTGLHRSESARRPPAAATAACPGSRHALTREFAELVASANPRLKFDAWAHHPYPFNPNSKPGQIVKWPNVSLASLPRFRKNLGVWFRQKNPQIWVTRYG